MLHIQILKFQITIFRTCIMLFISSASHTYLRTVLTKHLGINLGFKVWRLGSGLESVRCFFSDAFTWRYTGSQKSYNLLWWKVNIAIACTGISSNSPEHLYDLSNSFLHFPFLVTLSFHLLQVCFLYRLYSLEWALTTGGLQSPFISETKKPETEFCAAYHSC